MRVAPVHQSFVVLSSKGVFVHGFSARPCEDALASCATTQAPRENAAAEAHARASLPSCEAPQASRKDAASQAYANASLRAAQLGRGGRRGQKVARVPRDSTTPLFFLLCSFLLYFRIEVSRRRVECHGDSKRACTSFVYNLLSPCEQCVLVVFYEMYVQNMASIYSCTSFHCIFHSCLPLCNFVPAR